MGTFLSLRIYSVFLVTLGLASHLSAYYNDINDFNSFILPRCYNTTEEGILLVNGQDYPLSQTFENFISLVEKFENANPDIRLKDMLYIFLKNFTHENLVNQEQIFTLYFPQNADLTLLNGFWETEWKDYEDAMPDHVNPFDDSEICSLFYMLSHTINDTAAWDEDESKIYFAVGKEGQARADVKKTKHPREQGTVLIRSSNDRVALSRVLVGLYLGLNPQEIPIAQYLSKKKKNVNNYSDLSKQISPLYIMTLSDVLLMNKWPLYSRQAEIGRDGTFYGIYNRNNGINSDKICPTVYKLPENMTSLITYSLVRGATDGLILGSIISNINSGSNGLQLSQILRPYYTSVHGFFAQPSEETPVTNNPSSFSSCFRSDLLEPFAGKVKEQMEVLLALLSMSYKTQESLLPVAWEYFEQYKKEIFHIEPGYCQPLQSKVERKCETPVDVFIVLDTANGEEAINRQREIIGSLANDLELHPMGSTVTVLSDKLNDSSSLSLEEVVPQTYSSAAVACNIVQYNIELGSADRVTVIQAIDKLLEDRKKGESSLNGAPGKVVVYFNFNEEVKPNYQLDRVLGDLHRRHTDVTLMAVGRNQDVLQKFVGLNSFGVVRLISDDQTEVLGKELAKKVCLGPALLQYSDCKFAKDERGAVYEGYVTQESVQHWVLHAKYFEKSFTAKVFFDPIEGDIEVCHNRATSKPENRQTNCHSTNTTTRQLEFKHPNPCKGFSAFTCSPMYFSVIGKQPKLKDQFKYCTDVQCQAINQVKFKVSHEGIRCNGCSSLLSTSSLLLISLFAYFFCMKDN